MTKEEFDIRYTFESSSDKLGGGSFGTVYKVYDNFLNLHKALKVAEVKHFNGKEYSLKTEFENIKNISTHVNIANYEEVYQYSTKHGVHDFAIMQYYEDGTLKDLMRLQILRDDQKISLIYGILFYLFSLVCLCWAMLNRQGGISLRKLKKGRILLYDI